MRIRLRFLIKWIASRQWKFSRSLIKKKKKREAARQNANDIWKDR